MKETTELYPWERSVLAILALSFLAVGIMLSTDPGMAQKKPSLTQKQPESWTAYFPLTAGTEWEYLETGTTLEQPRKSLYRVRQRVPLKDGGACAEIEIYNGGKKTGDADDFLYFGLRKDGYYNYNNAVEGLRGVEENAPIPQVRFPLKADRPWKWIEKGREEGLVGENGVLPPRPWQNDCQATIEQLDEEVTVPAGKYRALRVRLLRKSSYWSDSEEVLWYAKGVGLIRQEYKRLAENRTWLWELTRYTPGSPKAVGGGDILPVVRKALRGRAMPRRFYEIALSGDTIRSRFVLAEWGAKKRMMFRVSRGKVTVFNPVGIPDWNLLFAQDEAKLPSPLGSVSRMLAQDMGILMAEGHGLTRDAHTFVEGTTGQGFEGGGMDISFTVTGTGWEMDVMIRVDNQGKIIALSTFPEKK